MMSIDSPGNGPKMATKNGHHSFTLPKKITISWRQAFPRHRDLGSGAMLHACTVHLAENTGK